MNPGGPVEEAGKVATGFLDVMRTQPLVLAMIVMNFALIGYVFYAGREEVASRTENAKLIISLQSKTQELLQSCVPVSNLETILKTMKAQ